MHCTVHNAQHNINHYIYTVMQPAQRGPFLCFRIFSNKTSIGILSTLVVSATTFIYVLAVPCIEVLSASA